MQHPILRALPLLALLAPVALAQPPHVVIEAAAYDGSTPIYQTSTLQANGFYVRAEAADGTWIYIVPIPFARDDTGDHGELMLEIEAATQWEGESYLKDRSYGEVWGQDVYIHPSILMKLFDLVVTNAEDSDTVRQYMYPIADLDVNSPREYVNWSCNRTLWQWHSWGDAGFGAYGNNQFFKQMAHYPANDPMVFDRILAFELGAGLRAPQGILQNFFNTSLHERALAAEVLHVRFQAVGFIDPNAAPPTASPMTTPGLPTGTGAGIDATYSGILEITWMEGSQGHEDPYGAYPTTPIPQIVIPRGVPTEIKYTGHVGGVNAVGQAYTNMIIPGLGLMNSKQPLTWTGPGVGTVTLPLTVTPGIYLVGIGNGFGLSQSGFRILVQ